MNKIISKSGMGRIFLMSFILFCSVFTSENAFSRRFWQRENMQVSYDPHEGSITFNFLFYDYRFETNYQHGYLHELKISYLEEGKGNSCLMKVATIKQSNHTSRSFITMSDKKAGEKIVLLNSCNPKKDTEWSDGDKKLFVEVIITDKQDQNGGYWEKTIRSYMSFKWILSKSCNRIKDIIINGEWFVTDGYRYSIDEVYALDNVKSNLNRLENVPSELKSVISNNKVKVTGETDAIIVKGAEPGENIQVYNALGAEVKSINAISDVVNIKLANNQIYLVKVGQTSYKVAL